MAVNFPSNPTIGQQVVGANNVVYEWDGEKWKSANNIGPSLFGISSGVPPSGASNGDAWFDTESGRAYVYYIDDDSAQWIDMSPTWNGTITDGSVTPEKLSSGGPSWTASGDFSVDTNTLYVDATNNRVGLGTSSVGTRLHIAGETDPTIRINTSENSDLWSTTSRYGTIQFYSQDYEYGGGGEMAAISAGVNSIYGQSPSLRFSVSNPSGGSANPAERMRLTSTGLGIGTTTPQTTNGGLDISSGGLGLIVGADSAASTRTDSTTKLGRILAPHYTNSEEPVAGVVISNDSSENIVSVGGGTGLANAATVVRFYTAANTTTTTGTERARIDSSGNVTMAYQPAVNYFIQVNTGTGVRTFTSKRTRGSTGLSSVPAGNGSSHGSVGRFTAPVSGVYLFTCSGRGTPPSSNNELLSVYGSWSTGVNTLNPNNELLDTRAASIGNDGFGTTFTLYLSANDYWELDWYRPAPTVYLGSTLWDISILLVG